MDGHDALSVLPYETHIPRCLGYPVSLGYSGFEGGPKTAEAFVESATSDLILQNSSDDQYSDSINLGQFDEKVFSTILNVGPLETEGQRVSSLFRAIHAAFIPNDGAPLRRVVEKSVSHAEHAGLLLRLFPEARFVHLVRNPYSNWLSLRKYKSMQVTAPLLPKMVKTMTVNFNSLLSNMATLGESYMVIKYEDLVSPTS